MKAKMTKVSGNTGKKNFNLKHAQWKVGQEVMIPYYKVNDEDYLFVDGVIVECKMSISAKGSVKYAVVKFEINGQEETLKCKMSKVFAKNQ